MNTISFCCFPQGNHNSFPVVIQIPNVCCGIEIKISPMLYGADVLTSFCKAHMLSYKDIWQNFAVRKSGMLYGVTNQFGINCNLCNTRNDQAEPNQEDGSYICFGCRNGY